MDNDYRKQWTSYTQPLWQIKWRLSHLPLEEYEAVSQRLEHAINEINEIIDYASKIK